MREEVMESTEDDFVRSLSHCVNWQAQGGKSGAVFYATEGDSQKFKTGTALERSCELCKVAQALSLGYSKTNQMSEESF